MKKEKQESTYVQTVTFVPHRGLHNSCNMHVLTIVHKDKDTATFH